MANQQAFWKDIKNHAELKRLLKKHELLHNEPLFDDVVHSVAKAWMSLARIHLKDAKRCCSKESQRSFYSRSYYAGYNASKAVRYLAVGTVSGSGDDHQKVSDLPTDFPENEKWGSFLRELYKHRLISDYDGWRNSTRGLKLNRRKSLKEVETFVKACKAYAASKYGVRL